MTSQQEDLTRYALRRPKKTAFRRLPYKTLTRLPSQRSSRITRASKTNTTASAPPRRQPDQLTISDSDRDQAERPLSTSAVDQTPTHLYPVILLDERDSLDQRISHSDTDVTNIKKSFTPAKQTQPLTTAQQQQQRPTIGTSAEITHSVHLRRDETEIGLDSESDRILTSDDSDAEHTQEDEYCSRAQLWTAPQATAPPADTVDLNNEAARQFPSVLDTAEAANNSASLHWDLVTDAAHTHLDSDINGAAALRTYTSPQISPHRAHPLTTDRLSTVTDNALLNR